MANTNTNSSFKGNDTGLGERYLNNTNRIINKDGSFNVSRKGDGLFWREYLSKSNKIELG